MTNEKLYEAIGDISDKKIKEAKQCVWIKWGTIAACLCLAVISIIGIEITNNHKPYTAILSNGNQITFYEGNNSVANLDIAIIGIRELLLHDDGALHLFFLLQPLLQLLILVNNCFYSTDEFLGQPP